MRAVTLRDVQQSRGVDRRRVAVLHGASLEIESGERVLLEGPSGSGKTTLLAVVAGLLSPERGEVVVAGRSLAGLSRSERCRFRSRHIGFVFQRANLLSGLTVMQNVLLAAALAGERPRDATKRAEELLQRLGVDRLTGRYPRELSGGEEQRVAVARALIHRPTVILADEPTGSLDPRAGSSVVSALTDLAAAEDCAVLVATHDSRLVEFATRRLMIRDGRIHETSSPDSRLP